MWLGQSENSTLIHGITHYKSFLPLKACSKTHLPRMLMFLFSWRMRGKGGLEKKYKKYLIKMMWFYATLKILFDRHDLDLYKGTKGINRDDLFLTSKNMQNSSGHFPISVVFHLKLLSNLHGFFLPPVFEDRKKAQNTVGKWRIFFPQNLQYLFIPLHSACQ